MDSKSAYKPALCAFSSPPSKCAHWCLGAPVHQIQAAHVSSAVQPVLGSQMYWLVWVALAGVGIGAGMTFVPSLPALMHATRTLVGSASPTQSAA